MNSVRFFAWVPFFGAIWGEGGGSPESRGTARAKARDLKKHPKKQGQSRSVAFSGIAIFRPILLRVVLALPARHQQPHDTNNPPAGRWGSCEPKWWPQGSSFSSSKTKQRTHKAKKGYLYRRSSGAGAGAAEVAQRPTRVGGVPCQQRPASDCRPAWMR
jgi:hypothetical protein